MMSINRAKDSPDHTLYTKDPIFEKFGLAMFDLDSLKEFCDNAGKNKDLMDYLTTDPSGQVAPSGELYRKILFGETKRPSILAWDKDLREYKEKRINTYAVVGNTGIGYEVEKAVLANRINLDEKYKLPDNTTNFYTEAGVTYQKPDNDLFLKDVAGSSSGCISWDSSIYYSIFGGSKVIEIFPRISLYLQDPESHSNKRVLATKQPIISDVPSTAGGTKYGATHTEDFEHVDGIGSYRIPINGNENLDNKRAGKLDISFNHNTGNYEAGTKQIIVRLLADLPPVVSPGFDPDTINSLTNVELYKKDGEYNQLGDWDKTTHICSGVPLYVQKANPYLFGPNFINMHSTTDKFKKEIISVNNRTTSSFAQNELVICSYINGEWIPQKFSGDPGTSFSFKIEKWSFTKLITDSDSYFRDSRLYKNQPNNTGLLPSYMLSQLDSESYQQKMRNKYYVHLHQYTDPTNAALNFNPELDQTLDQALANTGEFINNAELWDIRPSERYWQITSFDQMGDFAGGKNDKNIIARTNFSSSPDGLTDAEYPPSLNWLGFWGPSFIDGYNSTQVQTLLAQKNNIILKATGYRPKEFFFGGQSGYFVATPSNPAITDIVNGLDRNVSYNYSSPKGMFSSSDKTAKNLPAEVATNTYPGSPSIGSPLEDLGILMTWYGCDTGDMVVGTSKILESGLNNQQLRYHWLHKGASDPGQENILDPVYDLTPISPNKVDFFSLSAEMVSSTDYAVAPGDPNFTKIYGNSLLMSEHLTNPKYRYHMFGHKWIFDRNKRCGTEDPFKKLFLIDEFGSGSTDIDVIPYNRYVFQRSEGNSGGLIEPSIWPEENAECVGIISSKCKIKFKGNELKFLTTQQFGLPAKRTISLSSVGSFSILPLGGGQAVGFSNPGSIGGSSTNPRWGRASDNPEDFNTTALHVQIYDQWPDDQTIFDPRYFAVFHFNPNNDSVDFKIPTLLNGTMAPTGVPITSATTFAPEANWIVNPIRRGKMLNNGGFKYIKNVCGINNSASIFSSGTGYSIGNRLTVSSSTGSGAEIEVATTGVDGSIASLTLIEKGEGFLPIDFVNLKASGGTGTGADIKINSGLVYGKIQTDEGPTKRSDIVRLTDASNRGLGNSDDGMVKGIKETSIQFSEQNSTGKYDLFFHFHNDITHTLHSVDDYFYVPIQRVLLEINAN